jgi:hypothetical protein
MLALFRTASQTYRTKQICLKVPCAGHSITLVGVQAVDCNLSVTFYFDFVKNLYNLFYEKN